MTALMKAHDAIRRAEGLEAYIDALLAPPGPAATPEPLGFWLVWAAGLRFALPAEAVSVAAPPAEAVIVDLAAAAVDAKPAAPDARVLVTVAASPDRALAVTAVDGPIEVDPGNVRWRRSNESRPWLAGMLDAPRAAIVSIERLLEEA